MTSRFVRFAPVIVFVFASIAQAQPAGTSKSEVKTYLDNLTKSHNRLYAAGRKFGEELSADIQGDGDDHIALNKEYRAAVRELGMVLKETKEWKVPDTESARKLKEVNDEFLQTQVELMLLTLTDLIDVAEDDSLSTAEKGEKVGKIITEGTSREDEIGTKVRQAYNKLAGEFGIETE